MKQQLQLIFLTGKNQPIPSYLKTGKSRHKCVAVPFTDEIEKYFAASDVMIGKPGPNIVSQAIAQRVPVIVNNNFFTMTQEKYVADFVKQKKLGIVVKNFSYVDKIVTQLLDTNQLKILRENMAKEKNSAHEEIAAFIQKIHP
jgi:UDP-N-acetylglucosamine:LPS N-acetylglucosamine transferase